ncbi:MAG: hypothetical protein MH472_02090 [Bacteroidia bacterium]|nr:hypothetical protein [Bacteroidia bacterium]
MKKFIRLSTIFFFYLILCFVKTNKVEAKPIHTIQNSTPASGLLNDILNEYQTLYSRLIASETTLPELLKLEKDRVRIIQLRDASRFSQILQKQVIENKTKNFVFTPTFTNNNLSDQSIQAIINLTDINYKSKVDVIVNKESDEYNWIKTNFLLAQKTLTYRLDLLGVPEFMEIQFQYAGRNIKCALSGTRSNKINITVNDIAHNPFLNEWIIATQNLYSVSASNFKTQKKFQQTSFDLLKLKFSLYTNEFCAFDKNNIYFYEANTNNLKQQIKISGINDLCYSKSGLLLAVASRTGISILNTITKKVISQLETNYQVQTCAFSPEADKIALLDSYGERIHFIETEKLKEISQVESASNSLVTCGDYLVSNDNEHILVHSFNNLKLKAKINGSYKRIFGYHFQMQVMAIGSNRIDIIDPNNEKIIFSRSFNPSNILVAKANTFDGDVLLGLSDKILIMPSFHEKVEQLQTAQTGNPPAIIAQVDFIEPSGNKALDAFETAKIKIQLQNTGKGNSRGIHINPKLIEPKNSSAFSIGNYHVEALAAGEKKNIEINLSTNEQLTDGMAKILIDFIEQDGFSPSATEIVIKTNKYLKPSYVIADVGIEDNNQNGLIESGEIVKIKVRLKNNGRGPALNLNCLFSLGENIYSTGKFKPEHYLQALGSEQNFDLDYEFFINDKCANEIPLFLNLEDFNHEKNNLRIPLFRSQTNKKINTLVLQENKQENQEVSSLSIDIETNIPSTKTNRKNAIAIVLGIENYKNISPVSFAKRDAEFVNQYFQKALGIPKENIYFKTNEELTKAEFEKLFEPNGWLYKRVQENTEVYIYYAGHGAPDTEDEKAYLIPQDGDPNYAGLTGYSLDRLYKNLGELKSNQIMVFLDACFSGQNREQKMLLADARAVSIKPKNNSIPEKVSVLSASASNEVSSAWPEKKHGLFTYYLLKGLQGEADNDANNQITFGELGAYVRKSVSEKAGFLDRVQTPQFKTNQENYIIKNQ